MNNNCTKCGNPLQPGTTICPVCGTNNINATPAPAQPVAPGVAPAPVQPVPGAVATDPLANTMPQPVAPAPVAPVPGVNPADGVQVAPPVQPLVADGATGVQPVVSAPVVPDPNAPAAPAPAALADPNAPAAPAKEKKPVNKKLIFILLGVLVVAAIGVVLFVFVFGKSAEEPAAASSGSGNTSSGTTSNLTPVSKSNTMTLNGYTFNVPSGWKIDTSNGDVTIYDEEETVIIQLCNRTGLVSSLEEEAVKAYLDNNGYSNVTYTKSSMNNKDAVVITAIQNSETFLYEFYYLADDPNIVGAAVVYKNSEANSKNKNTVKQIVEKLSYESLSNAISSSGMYSNATMGFNEIIDSLGSSSSYSNSGTSSGVTPNSGTTYDNNSGSSSSSTPVEPGGF